MGTDDIKQAARPGRVTIRMVAAVSKVLHIAYGVSDGLRQNVMVSIERLGYRPSVAARGVRGQTYTIGILLVEIANPFLPMVIDGVNAVLGPSNYQALFGNGKPLMSLDASLIESMIDYRTDGLILIAPRMSGEHLAKFAVQIPIAVIGQHEPTTSNFDTVNVDDFDAAKLAVRTYVARGITDIAMVNLGRNQMDPENVTAVRERGYLAAMHEAGLSDKVRIMRSPLSMAGRDEFIAALLAPANRPHALFCWSDLDAIPIVSTAKYMGLTTPDDLAVIGFDNTPVASLPLVGLSSIDQSARKLGSLAAETVLSRIHGREVANHFLLGPMLAGRTGSWPRRCAKGGETAARTAQGRQCAASTIDLDGTQS